MKQDKESAWNPINFLPVVSTVRAILRRERLFLPAVIDTAKTTLLLSTLAHFSPITAIGYVAASIINMELDRA